MCDFEKALVIALTETFPKGRYVPCFFHFTRALFVKGTYLNLYCDKWKEQTKRMLLGIRQLPFTIPKKIVDNLQKLEDEYGKLCDSFSRFFKYFKNNFLAGRFSIFKWSYYQMIKDLAGYPRIILTNNGCETFNARLKSALKNMTPNCYEAIHAIRLAENLKFMDYEERRNTIAIPAMRGNSAIDEYLTYHAKQMEEEIRDGELDEQKMKDVEAGKEDIGIIKGMLGNNRDRFLMKFQRHLEKGKVK